MTVPIKNVTMAIWVEINFQLVSRKITWVTRKLRSNGLKEIISLNKERKEAVGWDWLKGFLSRNPTLSSGTPVTRAGAFNKPQTKKYSNLISKANKF